MSWEFLIAAMIVVVIPGTGVVYTVAVALRQGHQAAVAAALGCTLGIIPAILASSIGLAALMHTSAVLFQGVKYAGVAYLLYLAWQTLRESGPLEMKTEKSKKRSSVAIIRSGFLINILNPKLTVFFLAFLPQFINVNTGSPTYQMLLLGGIFMLMTFVVFVLYGTFASFVGQKVLNSECAMRWMRRLVAATFAGFGVRLALVEQ